MNYNILSGQPLEYREVSAIIRSTTIRHPSFCPREANLYLYAIPPGLKGQAIFELPTRLAKVITNFCPAIVTY